MKVKTVLLLVLFMATANLASQTIKAGALRAGAAKVHINPPAKFFDDINQNRGYSGLHDSIFVRSVVIDNGTQKAALVAMETSKVPGGDDLLNAILSEIDIPREYLYMAATHDHNTIRTSPDNDTREYYEQIKKATIESLKKAEASLQPARMGFAEGKAYVNTNRDEKIGEGYHMGYVPDGPSDKTVSVLTFTTVEGKPIAVYANYPVHAVVMYRATTKNGMPEVTGDLPGATSRYVESHFNGAVALWTSGAAGDQNPLFMATYNQDHPDVYDEGAAGYAILDVLSRRLGEEIVRLVRDTRNTSSSVKIWGKQTSVTCPGQKRKEPRDPNVPNGGYLAPAKIAMVDGDPVTIPLHLLMLNDIAFTGLSAEVFTEIGIHIKENSIYDRTMVVTVMPNDIGYIPTDKAYLMPSEKAISNNIKPGCAEPAIIEAFYGLMEEYVALNQSAQ